jgi:hypothetical protein
VAGKLRHVVASIGWGLVHFVRNAMSVGPGVLPNARHLPGDLTLGLSVLIVKTRWAISDAIQNVHNTTPPPSGKKPFRFVMVMLL